VQPLAVGAEDGDELDGAVDGPEPVRRPRRELDGLPRLDRQVLRPEQQPQAAVQDVEPVVALVDGKDLGRRAALGADGDLEGVQAARRARGG
jgi:hypothetical protein